MVQSSGTGVKLKHQVLRLKGQSCEVRPLTKNQFFIRAAPRLLTPMIFVDIVGFVMLDSSEIMSITARLLHP